MAACQPWATPVFACKPALPAPIRPACTPVPNPALPPRCCRAARRPRDQLHRRLLAPHGQDHGADLLRGWHAAGVGCRRGLPEDRHQAAGVRGGACVVLHFLHCCGWAGLCSSLFALWQGWQACPALPCLAPLLLPPLRRPLPPAPAPLQQNKPGRVSVTSCAYSADGRLIAGGMGDGTIQLWDVRGGSCAARDEMPGDDVAAACCLLPRTPAHNVLVQCLPLSLASAVCLLVCSAHSLLPCLLQASLGSRQQWGWCRYPSRSRPSCPSRRGHTPRHQVRCRPLLLRYLPALQGMEECLWRFGGYLALLPFAFCPFALCPFSKQCLRRSSGLCCVWCRPGGAGGARGRQRHHVREVLTQRPDPAVPRRR